MKTFQVRFLCQSIAFFVMAATFVGRADDVIVSQFNDASALTGWRFDYGSVTNGVAAPITFDAAQDANSSPTSGAMRVTFQFDAAAYHPSGNNKGAITIDLPAALNGSEYLTMEMDLKIETGSAADGSGNSGYFQMVIRNTGNYNFISQFGANVSTNNGWRHISVPPTGAREQIRAVTLELYGGAGITGPVTFFVDNIKFTEPGDVTDVFVSRFDTASSGTGWRFDYGLVTNLIGFDASLDASNNPASGSLKATFGFNGALGGNNKGAITYDLPAPLSGLDYVSMEMDVRVAPGSAVDDAGDSGFLQMILRVTEFYDFESQIGTGVRINDGWRHIRVSPPTGLLGDIRAITLELAGDAQLTGPVTFNIDNIKFTKPAEPTPGPTLRIERPVRGLNLTPASAQYERQSIAATNTSGLGWVGVAEPVTYAVTIQKYPGASHSGFQTHLLLVAGTPGADTAPDYSQPNVVFLDIQSRADGTAAAAFRYKVNETNGNAFLYGAGTLGAVTNPAPVGTWTLSLDQNTNVTVTAPEGNRATFVLPTAAAALFAGPLTVYVGAQANQVANLGQTMVLGRFRLARGASALIDDNFLADPDLDPATWRVVAGTPAGVQLVGPDAAFWLSWTMPNSGFTLQNAATLGDPGLWTPTPWTATQMGTVERIYVRKFSAAPEPGKNYEPDAAQSFFRMVKP